jgi:hypothetical protein
MLFEITYRLETRRNRKSNKESVHRLDNFAKKQGSYIDGKIK